MIVEPNLVYVETGLLGNSPITLTAVTSGTGFPRQWRIRVTQINCDSFARGWLLFEY